MEYDSVVGQYYDRARDYSSLAGRFTVMDPAGFGAGSANLYSYVDNGPANAIDPSGQMAEYRTMMAGVAFSQLPAARAYNIARTSYDGAQNTGPPSGQTAGNAPTKTGDPNAPVSGHSPTAQGIDFSKIAARLAMNTLRTAYEKAKMAVSGMNTLMVKLVAARLGLVVSLNSVNALRNVGVQKAGVWRGILIRFGSWYAARQIQNKIDVVDADIKVLSGSIAAAQKAADLAYAAYAAAASAAGQQPLPP